MVKRLFLLLLVPLLALANAVHADLAVVQGSLEPANGQTLKLFEYQRLDWKAVDSVQVDTEGHFRMQLDIAHRGWYKLGYDPNQSIDVILTAGVVDISLREIEAALQADFTESIENQHLVEFLSFNQNLKQDASKVQNIVSGAENAHLSRQEKQEKVAQILHDMLSRQQEFYLQLSQREPETLMVKLAAFNLIDTGTSLGDNFSTEHLNDEELASSFFYQGKLFNYIRAKTWTDYKSLADEVHQLIDKAPDGSDSREAIFIGAIRNLSATANEELSILARRYQMEFPDSPMAQALVEVLPAPGPQVGDFAPEIVLEDTDGQPLALSSLKGQYVLIDFWASWCRPCRVESPVVVEAYQRFKAKGFTIFGVSLDSKKENWLKAIEKDGLTWYHVSDLQGWKSAGASEYGVRSIPATYLIDPQGKIIARNLRGERLAQVLEQTLAAE